ncbi:MAG: hypothetical protein KJ832_09145 [Gammaproteobacteria bacterium]|nr:hypothetical protein [Gammaproteobacteria bacterium]
MAHGIGIADGVDCITRGALTEHRAGFGFGFGFSLGVQADADAGVEVTERANLWGDSS